jgi:exoribonuclease R
MTKGIKNKKYYRGVLRCRGGGRLGYDDCYIVVHQDSPGTGGKKKATRWSVSIKGRERINRALDGDLVAVEIISAAEESEQPKNISLHSSEMEKNSVGIAEETAVPSAADLEGLQKQTEGDKQGRVVGIIRRNWRQYAGSVVLDEDRKENQSSPSREGETDDSVGSTPALFLPVDPKLPPVRISSRSTLLRPPLLTPLPPPPTDALKSSWGSECWLLWTIGPSGLHFPSVTMSGSWEWME